jgi:hypothetical protein
MLRYASGYFACHTNNCVQQALASASFFHHLKSVLHYLAPSLPCLRQTAFMKHCS